MASAFALRQRIRRQQQELEQINRNQEELRRRLEQECNARISQLKRELNRTIAENRNRMNSDFQQKINLLQQHITAEMQNHIEEVRRIEKEARKAREAKLRELEDLNESLKDELEEIKNRTNALAAYSQDQAQNLKRLAVEQKLAVQKLPHLFFHPGQMDVYEEHLNQVDTMLTASMYDAAAATAEAVLSELQIFEITLHEDQRNWEEQYEIYRSLVTALYDQISAFEKQDVRTRSGCFPPMPKTHLQYWSGGSYSEIRGQVLEAYQMIQTIEHANDLSAYLNQAKDGIRITQFYGKINALHRLAEQVSAVITCIQSERYYSDERYEMANDAMEYLETQGYQILEEQSGFRLAPDGEPIDAYEVVATINGKDYLHLSFVPVRKDGVAVRNLCLVTVEMHTSFHEGLIKMIAEDTICALSKCPSQIQAEWNEQGITQLEKNENSIKLQPDMRWLAKKLERKY